MSDPELSFLELAALGAKPELPAAPLATDLWPRIAGRYRRRRRLQRMAGVGALTVVLAATGLLLGWPGAHNTADAVDWRARAQALELQLDALPPTARTRDATLILATQAEIARLDQTLQAAYDTRAPLSQRTALWQRRADLLARLIAIRENRVTRI